MNFVRFAVATTNIFPCANSTAGAQLLSEYNLRARESVATDADVKYMIGPSYAHSMEDFQLEKYTDGQGRLMSGTTLRISAGRALVNGHFVESLVPITIDLAQANAELVAEQRDPLKGRLAVGLRAMYSTEPTLAGSLIAEFTEDNTSYKYEMYEGIQVVVLPEKEMKLPKDVPDNPESVTAHLLLGTFSYINGSVSGSPVQNIHKCEVLPGNRIANVEELISDSYLSKEGLATDKLYVFSGKPVEAEGKPGVKVNWCAAQDSLMVWDRYPKQTTSKPRDSDQADFQVVNGKVQFRIPHKQIHNGIQSTAGGQSKYWEPRVMDFPMADYSSGTPGAVTRDYTNQIKNIASRIDEIYRLGIGKQRGYIPVLETIEDRPPIGGTWTYGDYIVVGADSTVSAPADTVRAPSTIYIIVPNNVTSISRWTSSSDPEGILVAQKEYDAEDLCRDLSDLGYTNNGTPYTTSTVMQFFTKPHANALEFVSGGYGFNFTEQAYKGIPGSDYFTITVTTPQGPIGSSRYVVATVADPQKFYSDAIFLTHEIPLASTEQIGGFFNVPETYTDGGYVIRDENGHLVLLDYAMLRSGTLAYQLGESFSTAEGVDSATVQENLDEYVNQRVAFPNQNHINNAIQNNADSNVIDVTIYLSEEEQPSEINIYDIDSRFNTAVYLHIRGTANANTVINISDCQRIRIDEDIQGECTINLYRSGLYYSATVLDRLNIIQDMSLWYSKFYTTGNDGQMISFDPDLQVEGMTVRRIGTGTSITDFDYWSDDVDSDVHYEYSLKSLSFASDGQVIGAELLIRNTSTYQEDDRRYVVIRDFNFPQDTGFEYPEKRITQNIRITGTFMTAIRVAGDPGCFLAQSNFTAVAPTYSDISAEPPRRGTIAIAGHVNHIDELEIAEGVQIDGWSTNDWHLFRGGISG